MSFCLFFWQKAALHKKLHPHASLCVLYTESGGGFYQGCGSVWRRRDRELPVTCEYAVDAPGSYLTIQHVHFISEAVPFVDFLALDSALVIDQVILTITQATTGCYILSLTSLFKSSSQTSLNLMLCLGVYSTCLGSHAYGCSCVCQVTSVQPDVVRVPVCWTLSLNCWELCQ